MSTKASRGNFASKIGIILATAGSAIGLGNIWRFPVETGQNGGSAFILIYLMCVLLLGIPMMTAEFVIGRHTHTDIATAYQRLAPRRPWYLTGYAGMFCVTLILSYYSVVAGWIFKYTLDALSGTMSFVDNSAEYFATFTQSYYLPVVFALLFILLTHAIIRRGIQNGIERFSKVMMPILLVLMIGLAAGSLTMPGAKAGMAFLLRPDFSKITSDVVLSALGQAFFSLSIAIGCLSTYASYFKPEVNLLKTSVSVVALDSIVAILSGFIIFPAVFSVPDVTPNAGPGLVFITLPDIFRTLFGQATLIGYLFALMLYLLLTLAALTSTISMHEEVTTFFVDHFGMKRGKAAVIMTLTSMALSVLCAMSFGPLRKVHVIDGMTFFETFDYVTAKLIMPISGIVLSVFVGWRLDHQMVVDELTNNGALHIARPVVAGFFFMIKWFAPIAIAAIFINELLS